MILHDKLNRQLQCLSLEWTVRLEFVFRDLRVISHGQINWGEWGIFLQLKMTVHEYFVRKFSYQFAEVAFPHTATHLRKKVIMFLICDFHHYRQSQRIPRCLYVSSSFTSNRANAGSCQREQSVWGLFSFKLLLGLCMLMCVSSVFFTLEGQSMRNV